MAFGVPGGSTNMAYFVLCGGGLTAAVVYVSIRVRSLHSRFACSFVVDDLEVCIITRLSFCCDFLKVVFHSKSVL